jgi:hypothetical protein
MTPTTATVTQTSATTVTQTYVVETTPAWAWAVIGVLMALLAVVAGLALRRRCTSFFLVLEFFLRILNRFWIFIPATPATHALFAGDPVGCVRVYACPIRPLLLLPGRKLPRAHAGPSEK